jgi:hypothetical protein
LSAASSGAGGGASIELTGRTLFASKYILGKNSQYYHQVQVHLDSIVSGLYVLEPKPQEAAEGKSMIRCKVLMAETGDWC